MTHPSSLNRRDFLKLAGLTTAGVLLPNMGYAAASTFPKGFLWGAASAAAQVESRKGRGQSNWDLFADIKGHIKDGSTNAVLTEFETRYAEDLKMLADAGLNAFRFSFAWPRIQPEAHGKTSAEGLDLYDRIIDEMLRLGIQPAATVFHWDSPLWAGDLRQREITGYMADYAAILAKRYGDRVKIWLALNEPNTVASGGYAFGLHAPGIASKEAFGAAIHHQNLAQGLIIQALRANFPAGTDNKVGTTINLSPARPATESAEDVTAAKFMDDFWNRSFVAPLYGKPYPESIVPLVEPYVKEGDMAIIAAKPDHLGVNYYSPIWFKAVAESPVGCAPVMGYVPPGHEGTQLFPVYPEGLVEVLMDVHKEYGEPEVYITETGFAVDDPQPVDGVVDDSKRVGYIKSYIEAAEKAVKQGSKLKGIFYWAATDNWEWSEGFTKTFGLVQIDRDTQARYPKKSLAYYGSLAKNTKGGGA